MPYIKLAMPDRTIVDFDQHIQWSTNQPIHDAKLQGIVQKAVDSGILAPATDSEWKEHLAKQTSPKIK